MKPSRGIFVSEGSPAAESRDAERGTRAALSVLVCIRFAFGFNQSDIFRKIENGGFDQFVQAVRINGKSFFLPFSHGITNAVITATTRAIIASIMGVRSIIYKTSLSSVSVSGSICSFFFILATITSETRFSINAPHSITTAEK